jgi:hypothetical protein
MMYAKVAQYGDVFVNKATLGAFRVTTRSWSTRLARVWTQTMPRLAAYHWLSMKRSFRSADAG